MIRRIRSLIVSILAHWKDLSQKQIGAGAGMDPGLVSHHLRKGALDDPIFERLLAGVRGRPAEIAIAQECAEGLAGLEQEQDLTAEERDEIEMGVLEASRSFRAYLTEVVRSSRALPPLDEYPKPEHLEPLRWLAGEQWKLLKSLDEGQRLAVVRVAWEFQHWALVERLCEESVAEASRDLKKATALATLAQEVAERVRGPVWWCNRARGYAIAHIANISRVGGNLKSAEALLEQANRLWQAGADPGKVFDPGRLLDLKGALRRAQRRFEEALSLLEQSTPVSRYPERSLIMKAFTLEIMGEYERAIQVLLEAKPLVKQREDPRATYMLLFNLAVNYCHLGHYVEAAELSKQVRNLASDLGDEIFLSRVTWLDGRIAAGTGHTPQALFLLEQAQREFGFRGMWYDVALAVMEIATLLLENNRLAEVKVLCEELKKMFDSEGIHAEALAALQLFKEASDREEITAELARQVLHYLFRARYDQGLRFEPKIYGQP